MPIQFFQTKDPALLAQYFELRNQIYLRHYPHLNENFGHEELADRHSHIVVGHEERVVAGGRITVSRPAKPRRMPMEEGGFRLNELLPDFGLARQSYAEFSRVAVDPAFAAGRHCGLGLIFELARTAADLGVDLVFSICPSPMVRLNAWNSRRCGVEFLVFPDIAIPNPFDIHMTLCAYKGLIAAFQQPVPLSA
jgi:hypothetical protein